VDREIRRGLAWFGAASSLVGLLDIIAILIILNHWVSREDYGIATLVAWMFPVLDQITDLGLSAAVIQRDDHEPDTISTVFWINLAMALAMFGLLVGLAPIISHVYGHAIIASLLVAYGTKLLMQNVYFIPLAMLKRELRYKEISIIRLVSNIGEFVAKVGFAAAGFGIWCFVLGPLVRTAIAAIGAQLCHPWWPRRVLKREAWPYVKFGLRASGSQILFHFYTNVDYPIVGYFFGPAALGAYRLAYDIVLEPVRMIAYAVLDIAFPAFAKLKHSRTALIAQLVRFTRLNLLAIGSYADQILALLFPAYTSAAPAVRILCAVALLRGIGFVLPPLLDGVGHPERTLRYMTVASIVMPLAFVIGGWLGTTYVAVAIAWAVAYPIAFLVLLWLATSTLDWSVLGFFRAVRISDK